MEKELMLKILMADRATRSEAEKHIQRGTWIIPATKSELLYYINDLKACQCWDGETVEGLLSGEFAPDRTPIEYNGKKYLIIYVL
jgi:hypothetical protein